MAKWKVDITGLSMLTIEAETEEEAETVAREVVSVEGFEEVVVDIREKKAKKK